MQSPHQHQQHMQQQTHIQSPHSQEQLHTNQHIQVQHHVSPHLQAPHHTSQHMQHPHMQQQQQQHHSQQQEHHSQQHQQHSQQQHHVYGNVVETNLGYQQFPTTLQSPLPTMDTQKQLHFNSYTDPESESNKSYRMPSELPYIKSPGMNRRDLKFLESAENKENAIAVDYNGPLEDSMPKPEENLYEDETLGTAPLTVENETCFTEAFNAHLTSSTPINHYKVNYKEKERHQLQGQSSQPQP